MDVEKIITLIEEMVENEKEICKDSKTAFRTGRLDGMEQVLEELITTLAKEGYYV